MPLLLPLPITIAGAVTLAVTFVVDVAVTEAAIIPSTRKTIINQYMYLFLFMINQTKKAFFEFLQVDYLFVSFNYENSLENYIN